MDISSKINPIFSYLTISFFIFNFFFDHFTKSSQIEKLSLFASYFIYPLIYLLFFVFFIIIAPFQLHQIHIFRKHTFLEFFNYRQYLYRLSDKISCKLYRFYSLVFCHFSYIRRI